MLEASIGIFFFALGILFQKLPTPHTILISTWVNRYLFYLVLPALALYHIPTMELSWSRLTPISAAWVTFLLSWLIFATLGKVFLWDRTLIGCLILVSGLANTSFLGFPIIEYLYGSDALATALLIDQAGSFLILSSLGIVVASIYGSASRKPKLILWKIISFPPFFMLLASLALNVLQLPMNESVLPLLKTIGDSMAPMALIAIGLRLNIGVAPLKSRFFWYGLSYRLLIAPACIYVVYAFFLEPSSLEFKVTILESAMAPMITASLIAIEYNLKPQLASQLAGIGIPISFLTLLF